MAVKKSIVTESDDQAEWGNASKAVAMLGAMINNDIRGCLQVPVIAWRHALPKFVFFSNWWRPPRLP